MIGCGILIFMNNMATNKSPIENGNRVIVLKGCNARGINKGATAQIKSITATRPLSAWSDKVS